MTEMYYGIKEYIPELCKIARRVGNHFECNMACPHLYNKEHYICPCLGKDGFGWISVTDEMVEEWISEVRRWNECRSRIPNNDKYSLEGIDHFRVSKFDLIIDQFAHDEAGDVKEELTKLFDNGDKIVFNEDWGVGILLEMKMEPLTW